MTGPNDSTAHDPSHAESAELAALYLSGAMTDEEREAFEARLDAGDDQCIRQLRHLQGAAEALLYECPAVMPPASVRERVMDAISTNAPAGKDQQIWRRWESDTDVPLFTMRAAQGAWEETGVDGVQVRRLFVDRPANRMTAMFRMAAGAEYPEHIHDGPEECYVLEGDLHVGEQLIMRRGDYQRALPGSEHGRQWTESGCLLLVTCSLSDQM